MDRAGRYNFLLERIRTDKVYPPAPCGHVYHTQSYCFGLTKILGERLQKKAPTSALVFYKFYGINTRLARSFCIHVKFLLNLGRAIKAKYVTLPARVVGRKQGHGIWVYTLEVNTDRYGVSKNSRKYTGAVTRPATCDLKMSGR